MTVDAAERVVDAVAYVWVEEVVILEEVAALTLTVPERGGVLLAVVAEAETVEPLSWCRGVLWRVLVAIGGEGGRGREWGLQGESSTAKEEGGGKQVGDRVCE